MLRDAADPTESLLPPRNRFLRLCKKTLAVVVQSNQLVSNSVLDYRERTLFAKQWLMDAVIPLGRKKKLTKRDVV